MTSLDDYDLTILRALEKDGALTNSQLSEKVHLSPSQCSRRRARLEQAGVIDGYQARLNPLAMGLTLTAVVRVNLHSHSEKNAQDFGVILASHHEIAEAFSVSGDADYVLIVRCENLTSFADFIHERLLPQTIIRQVRSEIVLRDLK
ncbi:MAG: Lrp/AsnC family transcriptional regulator [Candidatus Puniceispirillaceae bacterium]